MRESISSKSLKNPFCAFFFGIIWIRIPNIYVNLETIDFIYTNNQILSIETCSYVNSNRNINQDTFKNSKLPSNTLLEHGCGIET
jgi:hypothetical protein